MGHYSRTCRVGFGVLLLLTICAAAESARAQSVAAISEFRYNGPSGTLDEFVEIYNNTDAPLTVGASGWALVSSDAPATPKFVVPAGTVIPARGHFLGVNSVGYSLAAYPAGNGTTATGDAAYAEDIPDNVGLALFNTSDPAGFTLANRLDAVGTTLETNTLFKEGAGLPSIIPFAVEYSFVRHLTGACTNSPNDCGTVRSPEGGFPRDTNDNAADFIYIDTAGTDANAGQRLGAPGPENLSSPIQRNASLLVRLVDATFASSQPPNQVRDQTPVPNGTFGTLSIRRRIVNQTGAPVTRLRLRGMNITTFLAATGTADLRAITSSATTATSNDAATCSPAPAPCVVTIQGTTLEEPPLQEFGGGWNATLSVGVITLAQPLAPGESINLQLLFGVEQRGGFRIYYDLEVLP